jgi:hypothetical protein
MSVENKMRANMKGGHHESDYRFFHIPVDKESVSATYPKQ